MTLLLNSGADIEARNEVQLHRILDWTFIHIQGAGLPMANGVYKMSTQHGIGQRPEYRHCDNATFTISYGPYSRLWILDKPGSAPYRIDDQHCFDFDFPFEGVWLEHQSNDPPFPTTHVDASVKSPIYQSYATALHLAAQEGHLEVVRVLVGHCGGGANLEVMEEHRGRTPLHMAAERGHVQVVRFLACKAGAKVDAHDNDELTPLARAAIEGHLEVVRVLSLEARADVEAADGYGRTALQRASEQGYLALVKFLVLEGKATVDACDADGATALFRAAEHGHTDVVRFLIIEGKADVDREHRTRQASPLLAAAANGHSHVVRVTVLEGKANLFAADYMDRNAAELCCSGGHLQCLLLLWDLGHKPDDSKISALCDVLRKKRRLGNDAGFQWVVLRGSAHLLFDAFEPPALETMDENIVAKSSQDDGNLSCGEPGAPCSTAAPERGRFFTRESSRLLFAECQNSKVELQQVTDLDALLQSKCDGLLIVVPPRSDSIIVLMFMRRDLARQDSLIVGSLDEQADSRDDFNFRLFSHSVRVLQLLLLSSLDFSGNPSVVSLDIKPLLFLENLRKFVCRFCPKLKSIYLANTTGEPVLEKCGLIEIDVSDNILLEVLPLAAFAALVYLKSLICKACPQLYSPPQEVCKQGGRVTAEFVREVQRDGHNSTAMTLFLIGDGESGKTSTMKALKSPENVSERIREDKRTVGIDISPWEPEGLAVKFKIFDLAGQAVYGKTHQYFLQRRAVYMLVWRAHKSLVKDEDSLHRRIINWMDALQNRMPGSYMILVVTHIDAVDSSTLDLLCDKVCAMVQKRLQFMAEASREGTPVLNVFRGGQSAQVNCLLGTGVRDLRNNLITFTMSMPWYKESLPASWIRTQDAVQEAANNRKRYLDWAIYSEIASHCGLQRGMLMSATKFLHETGVIRYFGDLSGSNSEDSAAWKLAREIRDLVEQKLDSDFQQAPTTATLCKAALVFGSRFEYSESEVETLLIEARSRFEEEDFISVLSYILACRIVEQDEEHGEEVDKDKKRAKEEKEMMQKNGNGESSQRILKNTVFISPFFMINVMKGLIRHDRNTLLTFFMEENNKPMIRRVKRLSVSGRLHVALKPFLWPSTDESRRYWDQVKCTEEGELWPENIISDHADLDRAVALLEGFDLLALKASEKEIIVPGVLPEARTRISGDAFNGLTCPFHLKFYYLALPEGAYEGVIVRIAKTVSRIEYSASMAVFYRLGHMGQMFYHKGVDGKISLSLRSSSKHLLSCMKQEVLRMEDFFPGLIRTGLTEPAENNSQVEPVQVLILADEYSVAHWVQESLKSAWFGLCYQQPTIALQLPSPSDHRSYLCLSQKEKEDFDYHLHHMKSRFSDKPLNLKTLKTALKELKFDVTEDLIGEILQDSNIFLHEGTDSKAVEGIQNWENALIYVSEQNNSHICSTEVGRQQVLSFTSLVICLVEELTFRKTVSLLENSAARARVVIACITRTIGDNPVSCSQFARHIDMSRAVIPVIMQGFTVKSYTNWWPLSMSGFERHRLFVDLRNENLVQTKVISELVPQLVQFLEGWRAVPLVPSTSILAHDSHHLQQQDAVTTDVGDGIEKQLGAPGHQDVTWSESYHGSDKRLDQVECPECVLNGHEVPQLLSRVDIMKSYDIFLSESNEGRDISGLRHLQCSKCGAMNELAALLAPPPPPDMVPCPLCVQQCRLPPGAFEVSQCRLLFDEQDRQRVATVICPVCLAQLRVVDIAKREVFGSYCWGTELQGRVYSTQSEVVLPFLRAVEERADIMCWIDVEGGMGAGQNHLEEMKRGIQAAGVFLVFLSDAYAVSDNCIREFAYAAASCRYMIPVLVPSSQLLVGGVSSGWSGPGAEDPLWWQHAAEICGDRTNPDTGEHVDWACLGMYTPVVLSSMGGFEAAVDQVVLRVLSRLHRSAQLNTNTLAAQRRMYAVFAWRILASAAAGDAVDAGDKTNFRTSESGSVVISEGLHDQTSTCDGQESAYPSSRTVPAACHIIGGGPGETRLRELRRIFDLIDTDGSRSWDRLEVQAAVRALGMDSEAVDRLLLFADKDLSGTIDFDEFVAFFSSNNSGNSQFSTEDVAQSSSARRSSDQATRVLSIDRAFAALSNGGADGVITLASLEQAVTRAAESSQIRKRLRREDLLAMLAEAAGDSESNVKRDDFARVLRLSEDLQW